MRYPVSIIFVFQCRPKSTKNFVLASTIDHMRELFHKYECEAKWLFFVDADTVMVDLTRSLESVISYANHQYYPMGAKGGRGDEGCELIAQLSSSTINAGAIFFRISPASDELVRTWIQTHLEYKALGRQWQLDQVTCICINEQ